MVAAGAVESMTSMNPAEIDAVLCAAEEQVATRGTADLRGLGFWKVVGIVKRDPALIDEFADRIGVIDQAVFLAWAPLTFPILAGTVLAVVGTVVGFGLVGMSYVEEPWNGLFFLAGTAVLLATTHGLGHLIVGWVVGIRFTVWFAGYRRPQPGVKTDYATYLRTPARARAWMHASGALVTKAIPILLLPVAIWFGVPMWTLVILVVLAVGQIVTDVAWSTRSSDWAKFKREMRHAL